MKKIILLVIFFFPLLFLQKTFAQDKFHIGLNGGLVFQGPNNGLFDTGKNAWIIALQGSYSINPEIRLNIQTAYNDFANYKVYYNGVIANSATNNSTELNQSAKIYQLSLGITFISNSIKWIYPFISVYTGLYFLDYTNFVYNQNTGVQPAMVQPPVNEATTLTKGFASFGIGMQLPVADRFNLSLQTVFSSTYDSSNRIQNFLPVLFGVEYSF